MSPRLLAERLGCSRSYLSKTLGLLTRAGLLESTRGAHGGVRLVKDHERIRLLDIVEACQGRFAKHFCQDTRGSLDDCCGYHVAMHEVYHAMLGVMSKWRLSDLVARPIQRELSALGTCKMRFEGSERFCGWRRPEQPPSDP